MNPPRQIRKYHLTPYLIIGILVFNSSLFAKEFINKSQNFINRSNIESASNPLNYITNQILVGSIEKIVVQDRNEYTLLQIENLLTSDTKFEKLNLQKEIKSDKNWFWCKIIVTNRNKNIANHRFRISALSYFNLYIFENKHLVEKYEGGIFQNKTGTIKPDFHEDFELELQPGENIFALQFKNNLTITSLLLLKNFEKSEGELSKMKSNYIFNRTFQQIFFSILIFQFIYIFFQWRYIRNIEYLYYLVYIFLIGLYFLSKAEFLMDTNILFTDYPALTVYLDHFLCWSAAGVYFLFAQKFVNLRKHDNQLNKVVKLLITIIFAYCFIELIYLLITQNIISAEFSFIIFTILVTIITQFIIFSFFRMKLALFNFAIVGSLLISLGSLASLILYNHFNQNFVDAPFHPLTIFQITVLLELLCFTTGLAYKSRLDAKDKILSQQLLILQMIKNSNLQDNISSMRNNISIELHDDLGAQLSATQMFINELKSKKLPQEDIYLIDNSLEMLDSSIEKLRSIMNVLQNTTLEKNGFIAAIEELVNKINPLNTIQFSLSHSGFDQRLDQETEHQLFRIVQELINNTLKYANAKNIIIDVIKGNGKLLFMYEDDGKGFDLKVTNRGNGLSNMEQRVKKINGEIEFDTSYKNGFRAIVTILVD
jgi:signal transduction histidine kinase